MGLIKRFFVFFVFISAFSFPLPAQSASSDSLLATDIAKLERESNTPSARREALRVLARLYQLSGNNEKALEAWFGAAYATSSTDYDSVLEASRLLVSMGEYDRADEELRKIPPGLGETIVKARLLWAELMAFSRGDLRTLTQMASDHAYLEQRSEIYYVLWRTGGGESWKAKLLAEYPQSPEARISGGTAFGGGGNVNAAATPQWLFGSLLAAAAPPSAATQVPPASPAAQTPPPQPSRTAQSGTVYLQTGLFRVEANAAAEAQRLEKAGFRADLVNRAVNGSNLWAVWVDAGSNSNDTLRRLKSAGWPDAFPVTN